MLPWWFAVQGGSRIGEGDTVSQCPIAYRHALAQGKVGGVFSWKFVKGKTNFQLFDTFCAKLKRFISCFGEDLFFYRT